MNDILIAGAGLGGTCAALWLSESNKVTLLSGTAPAASSIAAGLVNPFTGQRMRGFWNSEIAYEDFLQTLSLAGALETYNPCGILRPALDKNQSSRLQKISSKKPDSLTWIPPSHMHDEYPYVSAPFGAVITKGGIADTPKLIDHILSALIPHCNVLHGNLVGWEDSGTEVNAVLDTKRSLQAKKLILAVGAGYLSFPKLRNLNLHCTKGQIVHVAIPMKSTLPVSGHGYAVPTENSLILGTTYEHSYTDLEPTKEGVAKILALTEHMIPNVRSAKIIRASAGIRVGVPGTRLPMTGPLSQNVWVLTGLGSKGLLFGSHIGRNLQSWITDPSLVPKQFCVWNN